MIILHNVALSCFNSYFRYKHRRVKTTEHDIMEYLPGNSTSLSSIYTSVRDSRVLEALPKYIPELPPRDDTYSQPFEDSRPVGSCVQEDVNTMSAPAVSHVGMPHPVHQGSSAEFISDSYLTLPNDPNDVGIYLHTTHQPIEGSMYTNVINTATYHNVPE